MSEIRPLRAYAEVALGRQRSPANDDGPYMVPYLRAANVKDGVLDLGDVKQMNFTPAEQQIFALKPGDVLVTEGSGSLGAVGASAVWADELEGPVCFQNTVLRLRPRPMTDGRFLGWWCRHAFAGGVFASIATGANIYHVSAARVRSLPSLHWPLEKQRKIATFLDIEIGRVDALIASKRHFHLALMSQTEIRVERLVIGLDCSYSKPSLSSWFIAVPSGWLENTLRHVGCEVQTGPFGSQLHAEEYVHGGWPVVNPANLVAGRISAIGSTISNEKREELARHVLRAGDIVFGRRGEMGRSGLVDDSQAGWLCGTGSLRLRLVGRLLLPEYLDCLLRTRALNAYFSLASIGSTMDNLNSDSLLSAPVLVPPVAEQRTIVDQVADFRRRADKLDEIITRQIALLLERRQALITAAVTGELDIPEAA